MKINLLLICLSISIISFSQKTKTQGYRGKNYYEIYDVLKKKKNIRHGSYKRYRNDDTLLVEGQYEKGLKIGIWSYYGWQGKLKKKYDYDNDSITFFNAKADTTTDIIRVNGKLKRVVLEWPPQYIGGESARRKIIQENTTYPMEAVEMGESGTVKVGFFLTPEGKAIDHYIKKSVTPSLDKEALRVVKLLVDWTPARYGGENIELLITVPIVFHLS